MLIPALLIHILGRFIPSWIFRWERDNPIISWKYVFSKLSGSATSLFVSFIIICVITIAIPVKYLLNENAIYGIECSSLVKELGFEDGDKIISIQGQPVKKFADILPDIILEDDAVVTVKVKRAEAEIAIPISTTDKIRLMQSSKEEHFIPMQSSFSDPGKTHIALKYSEERRGLSDALQIYGLVVKQTKQLIIPSITGSRNVIISDTGNLKSALFGLSMALVLVGLISLLPIPGLDMGNAIMALIEKIRERRFNSRKIRNIKIICLTIFIFTVSVTLYLG